jgi:hypothetical protein
MELAFALFTNEPNINFTEPIPKVIKPTMSLYQKLSDFIYTTYQTLPQFTDVIAIRNNNLPGMNDTILIPTIQGDERVYHQFQCATSAHQNRLMTPGCYKYRLLKKYNFVYGQQMEPVRSYPGPGDYNVYSDRDSPKLYGINLIVHPIHSVLKTSNPLSDHSPASIKIDKSAYHCFDTLHKEGFFHFNFYLVSTEQLL